MALSIHNRLEIVREQLIAVGGEIAVEINAEQEGPRDASWKMDDDPRIASVEAAILAVEAALTMLGDEDIEGVEEHDVGKLLDDALRFVLKAKADTRSLHAGVQ